jgi:hypothetical protein
MMKRLYAKSPGCKDAKRYGLALRRCSFAPLRYVLLLLLLAACVPAQQPDVLKATPGPAFVVTDQIYKNGVFRVHYPSNWQVVTGEASQPPSVIFVAPDEISTIQLQTGILQLGGFSDPAFKTDIRGLTLSNGVQITAIFKTPPGSYQALLPTFEQVISSAQPA